MKKREMENAMGEFYSLQNVTGKVDQSIHYLGDDATPYSRETLVETKKSFTFDDTSGSANGTQ